MSSGRRPDPVMSGGRTETNAHIRKCQEFLHWLGEAHPDAALVAGGAPLGTWGRVVAGWYRAGSSVYLRLNLDGAGSVRRVVAVRPASWGATIETAGSPCGRTGIHVVWHDTGADGVEICEEIAAVMWRWARERWPGCRLISCSRRTDRQFSISGRCLRLLVRRGNCAWLLLAPARYPCPEDSRTLLTQALLWHSRLRRTGCLPACTRAFLFAPAGEADVLSHRAACLDPAAIGLEVWELHKDAAGRWSAARSSGPAVPQEGRDYRWPAHDCERGGRDLSRVLALAPSAIRLHGRLREYDSLRLFGLEFARAYGEKRDRIEFGVGPERVTLDESNFGELRRLVDEILYYRRPDSPDRHHPYYRLQSERWLESLILDDRQRLFPELAHEHVYPQIPVYLGDLQGRADILAADLDGVLVVMELKTAADPELPLQCLDYWGRVLRHNCAGDFQRRGYFPGMTLRDSHPKMYLVAPVFSFHDSTERLLRYFRAGLEIWKIAVNEEWRAGVDILRRIRYLSGPPAEA